MLIFVLTNGNKHLLSTDCLFSLSLFLLEQPGGDHFTRGKFLIFTSQLSVSRFEKVNIAKYKAKIDRPFYKKSEDQISKKLV